MSAITWTVVTRKNGRGQFRKTGFEGTWHEAVEFAEATMQADQTLEVWYVPSDETYVEMDDGRKVTIAKTREEKAAEKSHREHVQHEAEAMYDSWLRPHLVGQAVSLGIVPEHHNPTPLAAAYALAEAGWTRRKLGFRMS